MLPKLKENEITIKKPLPSGKNVGIMPWKVKDEKDLLFAIENLEQDDNFTLNSKKEMFKFIAKCVDTPVFDELSNTDVLKIAAELRKVSKGDTVDFNYTCPHCGHKDQSRIDLNKDLHVKNFDNSAIKLSDDLTINIKEVSHPVLIKLIEDYKTSNAKFEFYYAVNSILSILYKGELFQGFTTEELEVWLGTELKPTQYETLYNTIVEQSANVELRKEIKCLKCKKEVVVEFGDLYDFLIL